jgi:hypothetical protein
METPINKRKKNILPYYAFHTPYVCHYGLIKAQEVSDLGSVE